MDFRFTDEEKAVAELARKILEDKATNERLKALEGSGGGHDADLWKALADANLLGVAIGEEHGGSDLGLMALALLLQEVGRAVAPVPVYPALALGALPLARFGSADAKRAWLPKLASGEAIWTAALCELDSSDPLRPTTRAERAGQGFRLSGEKSLVPAARQAAGILVPARLDGGDVAVFAVEPGAPGLRLEDQKSSDGQPHAYLALDGVEVAPDAALGGVDGGAECLRWIVEHATAARCAMQLGVLERALEMTAQYGRDRVQFERPIGSFQAFHQRAADAYIAVEAIRLATWEALWRLSRGLDARDAVAVAKYHAAEGGHLTAYACQHLHGGIGIDVDYPLHRYFVWATQIEHELGSARHQLERLGERIADGSAAEV